MKSIFRLSVIYAERHIQALHAECHYAECSGALFLILAAAVASLADEYQGQIFL